MEIERNQTDFFISHASEDKEVIARPLAELLRSGGARVWYDEHSLKYGDSLRESIEGGLAGCRYCVVILSRSFFNKKWTVKELNGVFTRDVYDSNKSIIPIYYDITPEEVSAIYPMLSDILGIQYKGDISECVRLVLAFIGLDESYTYRSGSQYVTVKDYGGNLAEWIVEREIVPNLSEPLRIEFPVLNSYNTKLISYTGGDVTYPVYVGGQKVAVLDIPYAQKDHLISVRLIFEILGGFTEQEEIICAYPKLPYGTYTIAIRSLFRRMKDVRAYKLVGARKVEIGGLTFDAGGLSASLQMNEVPPGFMYNLAWRWAD